jgi:hypothetical protein
MKNVEPITKSWKERHKNLSKQVNERLKRFQDQQRKNKHKV